MMSSTMMNSLVSVIMAQHKYVFEIVCLYQLVAYVFIVDYRNIIAAVLPLAAAGDSQCALPECVAKFHAMQNHYWHDFVSLGVCAKEINELNTSVSAWASDGEKSRNCLDVKKALSTKLPKWGAPAPTPDATFDAIDNCKKYLITGLCQECKKMTDERRNYDDFEPKNGGSSCGVRILEMLVISGAHSICCFALLRGIWYRFSCVADICLGWAPCVFLICCLGAHQRTQVKRSDSWIRAMSMLNGRRCFGLCLIHVQKC